MSFFTKEQYLKLCENGKSQNPKADFPPVVKLHIPGTPCAWLISEMVCPVRNLAWGLYNMMGCIPLFGYIDLTELAKANSQSYSRVEVDRSFEGKYPMSVYLAAAKMCDKVTDKEIVLQKLYAKYLMEIRT